MSAYQNAFSEFLVTATDQQTSNSSAEVVSVSSGGASVEESGAESQDVIAGRDTASERITPDLENVQPSTQDVPQDLSLKTSPVKEPPLTDLPSGSTQSSTGSSQDVLDLSKPATEPIAPIPQVQTMAESPSIQRGLTSSKEKSIGSKLDKIAQKLMGGISQDPVALEFPKVVPTEDRLPPPVTSPKMLPQDEAAIQGGTMDEPQDKPPPERPFSVLLPPSDQNEDSAPEYVEELVSDNVIMEFIGEGGTGENSETCSQNEGSVGLTPLPEEVSVSSIPDGDAEVLAENEDITESETAPLVEEGEKSESRSIGEISEEISQGTSEKKSALKLAAASNGIKLDHPNITAETLFEYQWPPERGEDIFMLQEQVSEYLGVLSFKRKYPDLQRRPVEYKERIFLMDRGVVSEVQCDLGLTVLRSEEVHELMSKDYPAKYKDFAEVLREKERKRLSEENRGYSLKNLEKAKMEYLTKKAIRAAATFNAQFMQEKREERRAYFDMQTFEVQFPRNKYKPLPKEMTRMGDYPLALIPGQYQDHYKSYTPQELKYFPVMTTLYSPHRTLNSVYADPALDERDKDTADETKDGSSSSSDDSQSGTSDSEPDSIEGEVVKNPISEEQIKKLLATPRPDTPPKKTRKPRNQNGADTGDSEKDSETGSTKGRGPRKTPGKKTPRRRNPNKRLGRPPLSSRERCNLCQEVSSEEVVQCFECKKYVHPTCAELTSEMIPIIKTYPWQCMECKACLKCQDAQDEEKMMFCDLCDRGYHTYCVGLTSIPEGRWECPTCTTEGPTPKKKAKQK